MNQISSLLQPVPRNSASQWQQALSSAIRTPEALLEAVELTEEQLPAIFNGGKKFPLRVPLSFVARMKKGDANDPLLRQVLPLAQENAITHGYLCDPVGDLNASKTPGLLQKYHGRALLITTAACAVHCRYCFRRHFPYQQQNAASSEWDKAVTAIAQDKTIAEVILSGGDPLAVSDHRLATLLQRLEQIPHLKRLRIHTRLPVVIPQRVCDSLLTWLNNTRLTPVVVIHSNHPNEIDTEVSLALKKLQTVQNIMLLNQSVLLRGINDNSETLVALSEALFTCGVMPYYLHLLDKAQGTAHFDLPLYQAKAIYRELHARLPGYLVPRLALEQPGASGKNLLSTHL